ncbi:MAG: LOG family protein [Candidatus Omnitrophota bacterium]|nr:LOG family protein [Candidatus Omnitrophota bacterium]
MSENKKKSHSWLKKSYNNYSFLNSPAARTIRVLSELIEPESRFRKHNLRNTVVFFGSARTLPRQTALKNLKTIELNLTKTKKHSKELALKYEQAKRDVIMSRYYEDAVKLSEKLTRWFKDIKNAHKNFVICSGGGPGIMEAANRGAKNAKGQSIGLNISLPMEQTPNPYQSKELTFEFHYFFIRKFWFFYPAKALIVFPGGYGTLDEFFELLTLVQTNKSKKYMPIVLYGSDYWKKTINFDEMVKWGVISEKDLKLFKIFDNVQDSFTYLKDELTKHYI